MSKRLKKIGRKLNLRAEKNDDLVVLSALSQDAIIKISNMTWAKKKKRFIILMTRYCWEFNEVSYPSSTDNKRVNSILSFDTVFSVKSKGIDQSKSETLLCLLTFKHQHSKNKEGKIELLFSGGGNITLWVECIEVILKDVSESFNSATSRIPYHPITDPDND